MRAYSAFLSLICVALLSGPASRAMTADLPPVAARSVTTTPAMDLLSCEDIRTTSLVPASFVPNSTAMRQQGPKPTVCVDTFNCGGCCGNIHQVENFLRCCERGDGFACAARFGCR